MVSLEGTGGSIVSYLLALAFTLSGVFWILRQSGKIENSDRTTEKISQFWLIMIAAFLLALLPTFGSAQAITHFSSFDPSVQVAKANEIIEVARGNIQMTLLLVLTLIGLFVPVLVGLWSSGTSDFLSDMRELREKIAAAASRAEGPSEALKEELKVARSEALKEELEVARSEFVAIQDMGRHVRPFLYGLLVAITALLLVSSLLLTEISVVSGSAGQVIIPSNSPQVSDTGSNMTFVKLSVVMRLLAELSMLLTVALLFAQVFLVQSAVAGIRRRLV